MNRVYVSLGSNIEREKNLPAALRSLKQLCHVLAVSPVYETAPVGLEDQPNFWNAAILVETSLDATDFRHHVLIQIEQDLKRVRTEERNAPRTIDADMTLFNLDVFDLDDTHHIPDPDLLKHTHLAVPMADLDPGLIHPETGESLEEIAGRLMRQALKMGKPPLWKRPDVTFS